MKAYLITYKFYYDNELYSTRHSTQLRETPYEEEYSGIDFDSLWDFTYEWAAMIPFDMYTSKKGERFLQHYDWFFKKITPDNCKSWKFVITSQETSISMNELMKYNTESVIKYLKERGITTCPMNL